MPTPDPRPSTRSASPRVEVGTALDQDPALRQRWEEQLAASRVDPALWTGAFATNVWAGRYEMDGVLGHGGQGSTFVGTDRKTGARVAVKVLDLKHASDWKRVELFEREARVLRDIEHDGMPAFIDLIEDEATGARALVMSLVAGEDLETVTKREGPLAEAALWRALLDVTGVLDALHSRDTPVVHRDLKPRNLVRRADGRIAVVDFGGVGARGDGGSTVVGTFGYMAPEQLYGKSSPATDIYALGATLIALATGQEPEDLPRRGLSIDVDEAAPHLSEPLRRILKRMVAADPSARPADARALTAELTRLVDQDAEAARFEREAEAELHLGGKPVSEIDQALELVSALVRLLVGVFGTVAVVILGEVILPIAFAIASSLSHGQSRQRVERAKQMVSTASKVAREGFQRTAREGAQDLERIGDRDKQRRRVQRQRRKELRRGKRGHHGPGPRPRGGGRKRGSTG